MAGPHFFEFGPYRLDVALSRLERGGETIAIPPRAFDLLLLLARNRDRVMSKRELMDALWPDTFVEDANLTQHVYTLRKALGEGPAGVPYIETIPRRGYRLAAVVREVGPDAAAGTAPAAAVEPSVAAAHTPLVYEGERKRAAVLHCTIADADAVAERLSASEMHRLSERLLALAAEEIAGLDGVITHKQPDGFVAVFGARVVHEDDPRRAVLAAQRLVRRAPQLPAAPAPDDEAIAVRIGIATGPLVVTRMANAQQIDYVAVGDPLRAASLLQQFADRGGILITDATRRAVERYVDVAPAGDVAGTATYRVIGVRTPAHTAAPAARVLAPFLGRDREASLLQGLLAEVMAERGQIVSVVGEPGLGKSRLVDEATRAMLNRDEPVLVLEGRCVSYGSLVPYLPLIDLIRAHCEVSETDTPDAIRHAISSAVARHGLPQGAGTWLLRLVGVVDEAAAREALSPEAVKARTFDALRLLFLKAAAVCPLVLVVEDIHWIDRTSEEFLSMLATQLAAARILLIATYRPGYRPPWMDRSYVSQITLAPLNRGDSSRLVESVAGEARISGEIAGAILRRGEGNPFFLEELARTVMQRGDGDLPIPETVQGVIMARLDRLPDTTKRLLQTASVIGREPPLRVLTRVWDGPADVAADIDELCRQEFIYERPGGDDRVYVFKHALTQDVAYDSLLARRRRDLHLAAARALEELHAGRLDEIAATLAYHYARTDLIDEAVTWLMRAADQAARVYANAEALLHLDLASRRLQRVPEGAERDRRMLDVALRQAHSLYFLGRFRESVDVLLPHGARVARLQDPSLAAAYAFWLAHMYSRLGDQRRAQESAHRAIEAATRAGDRATLGKAHGLLALEGHWSGRTADGITHGEQAVDLLAPLADQRWWLGMAHFYLAMNRQLTGDFETALADADRADRVGKQIGDPRLQTYAGFTSGFIELSRGRAAEAVTVCRRSLEQAPDRVSRAYASMMLAYAQLEAGDHASARERLHAVIGELESFGFPQWHALSAVLIGEAERRDGHLDRAAELTKRGIEMGTQAQYWYGVGVGERIAGRIARDRGQAAEAQAAFERSRRVFDSIGATVESSRTAREMRS